MTNCQEGDKCHGVGSDTWTRLGQVNEAAQQIGLDCLCLAAFSVEGIHRGAQKFQTSKFYISNVTGINERRTGLALKTRGGPPAAAKRAK